MYAMQHNKIGMIYIKLGMSNLHCLHRPHKAFTNNTPYLQDFKVALVVPERNTADNTSIWQGEGTSNGGGSDNEIMNMVLTVTVSRNEKVAPSVSFEGTILSDRIYIKPRYNQAC